ncbi:MAG: cupredoxin domain-containing protein [Anaerolineales bacterium]
MNIKRFFIFVVTVGAVLTLAACGSSGPAAKDVTIQGKDIAFDITTLEARQGQTVNVTYVNVGALEHTFVIKEFNVKETAQRGETIKFSFTASEAGTFKYVCDVPGHTEAGMVGTLTVTP